MNQREIKEEIKTLSDMAETKAKQTSNFRRIVQVDPKTGQEVFVVASIHNRRLVEKQNNVKVVQYFVKWLGYSDSEMTWEPKSNLTDDNSLSKIEMFLKKNFERSLNEREKFQCGRIAEKVCGISKANGYLQLLMKWEGIEEPSLVDATEAHIKCPQLLIKFYESRSVWEG